jgi:hypothetical protein
MSRVDIYESLLGGHIIAWKERKGVNIKKYLEGNQENHAIDRVAWSTEWNIGHHDPEG